MVDSSVFQRRLAESRARRAEEQQAAKIAEANPADFADLVPSSGGYQKSDVDIQLDKVVDGVGILEAYAKWCGKMTPTVLPGQFESIKVSCPIPGHADANPSAWVNTDNNTWFCQACAIGGDTHDIAAYFYGMPVPGYKTSGQFHELRTKMASDFGYTVNRTANGERYLQAPEEVAVPVAATESTPEPDPEPVAPQVTDIMSGEDVSPEDVMMLSSVPKINWQDIVPPESFLDVYMRCTVIDDVAEEYHFWNGLLALGFAINRGVRLYDTRAVTGNMFICTLGISGSGKSKAQGHLNRLLAAALPYCDQITFTTGVKRISSPASAEVLVEHFSKPITDPANPKNVLGYGSVSGLIEFNELSALIGKANRHGSVLKPMLMEFYDGGEVISTSSLANGIKIAEHPFASALTTSQPSSLRGLVSAGDDASGFLNRWVFVAGPEKKRVAIGGAMVDTTPAVAPLKKVQMWAKTFSPNEYMDWSHDAISAFEDWFYNVFERDRRMQDSDILTRTDLLMKKLVLLFASNKMERVVSEATVKSALSLYPYIKACYSVPEREIRTTVASEVGDAILERMVEMEKRTGKPPTARELTKSLWRKNYPKDVIVKNLENLEKLGIIVVVQAPSSSAGGRPTQRYHYAG